jgi:TolA-binding protein
MMMRKLIISLGLIMLVAGMAPAQKAEQKGSGFSSWLRDLQKKIDAIAPRKSLTVSTGVAGVRGAKDGNNKDKLYWKGKKGEEPVTEAELAELREALAFAEKGDAAAAVKELEEFMKQYPDSALIPDAKKGLDMLKMEAKASPSEATQK